MEDPVSAVREQLFASTFWSARRAKFPLTEGHFVLRLNDPAIEFGPASAADLLRCYGHLRLALAELAGATAAHLYIALNWQPVGDAVGEPLAETSTPTLHAFFFFPGSTTASSVLRLPAHLRVAAGCAGGLDARLRAWNGGKVADTDPAPALPPDPAQPRPGDPAPGQDRSWEPTGWEDRPFHIEPAWPTAGEPFRGGHWTAIVRSRLGSLDRMDPAALVDLAATMQALASHSRPAFQGVTVWVRDVWESPTPATFHIFARRHGQGTAQVADFVAHGGLDFPLPRDGQRKIGDPSPTVER